MDFIPCSFDAFIDNFLACYRPCYSDYLQQLVSNGTCGTNYTTLAASTHRSDLKCICENANGVSNNWTTQALECTYSSCNGTFNYTRWADISSVQAFNTVHTNCTLPPQHANFVTAPNTRGTLQILWSSLFTILACTWTVLHLNIPKNEPKPKIKNFKEWLKWMVDKYQHPIKWFLLTVLAPEVSFAKYWDDQVRAHSLFYHYENVFKEKNWTRTHVLFANMGGFALRYTPNEEDESCSNNEIQSDTNNEEQSDANNEIQSHSDNGEQLGSNNENQSDSDNGELPGSNNEKQSTETRNDIDPDNADPADHETSVQADSNELQGITSTLSHAREEKGKQATVTKDPAQKSEVYYLTAHEAFKLLCTTKTSISGLENVSMEEINDRSKTDAFMRILAIGQILWVVVQILSRAIYGLAVTQLEVTVVAFAVCAVGMYIVNNGKPKGVNLPILFDYAGSKQELINELEDAQFPEYDEKHRKWKFYKCKYCNEGGGKGTEARGDTEKRGVKMLTAVIKGVRVLLESDLEPGDPVGNGFIIDSEHPDDTSDMVTDMAMFIGSMVFGGIHLIAWDFQFPTKVERYLWWAAALWCTVCVVACTLLFFTLLGLDEVEDALKGWLYGSDHSSPEDIDPGDPAPAVSSASLVQVSSSPNTDGDAGPDPSSNEAALQDSEKSTPLPLNSIRDEESQASSPHHRRSTRAIAVQALRVFFQVIRPLVTALFYFVAILLIPFTVAYVVARLFIIVEMFRTLAFLPTRAYVATWSSEIPNIG
ncbi:hypothetical protein ASPBRDRAFT_202997 [Aspergillus brasiliensis CBS 101740]|uniref:Uncharacterized protein n=1 Tax=Aspergillus brasiliensis (strain CBS 101740 / IMI 381727 / IBT 21946) TaxID=767769 RepID=A0A1L9V2X6_ASPBC|nr:hypothetical protein ASPBRDRAFT_202997 [Aspergillus brasiliensis CBS 101740]